MVTYTGLGALRIGNGYGLVSGTSFASPVVAGIAGVIWSNMPELTYRDVKKAIVSTCDKNFKLRGKTRTLYRILHRSAFFVVTENLD